MKLLLATFIFFTTSVIAQEVKVKTPNEEHHPIQIEETPPDIIIVPTEHPDEDGEICEFPEVMPEFPGGNEKLFEYITKNIQYPETMSEMGIQGRVYVQFIVEKNGKISEVKILRGVHSELDREAKRVVRQMPPWTPGECREGVVSRCLMRLPITFRLAE